MSVKRQMSCGECQGVTFAVFNNPDSTRIFFECQKCKSLCSVDQFSRTETVLQWNCSGNTFHPLTITPDAAPMQMVPREDREVKFRVEKIVSSPETLADVIRENRIAASKAAILADPNMTDDEKAQMAEFFKGKTE